MALPPNYLFVNPKDGRLVSQSYLQVPGGTSTVPSISFIDSANSGLSCDASGVVSIISAGSQKVTVGSTTTINSPISLTDALSFPLGTAALPSLYPGTDTNTGIYSPGADQVAISTGGTGRLFVGSTGVARFGQNSSDVPGIGNTTTGVALDGSTGYLAVSRDSGTCLFLNKNSNGDVINIYIAGANPANIGNSSGSLYFATGGSERLRITSAGNVGIGTASPTNTLHLAKEANHGITLERTTSSTGSVILNVTSFGAADFKADNNFNIQAGTSSNVVFYTNGVNERARIDSSGRLLVGTTTQKGLLTLGSGSHYSVVDPGATIKKVDYTSAMGSESFFSWRTWRSGKNYASGVSGVATIAVPSPSLLRVKIMATADGVGVRNYAYEAYVLATPVGVYTIDVIKQTTLLTGGSSPAMSGSNLVFTCPAAASNQSLIYVEVEQVSSQSDTTITFS